MKNIMKTAWFWPVVAVVGGFVALLLATTGCGGTSTTSGDTSTTAGKVGKIYVAVPGSSEQSIGTGNMGIAIVDLATSKVEMIDLPESSAPQGIIFATDTKVAPGTYGRVATEAPGTLYVGNAQDGSVNIYDVATQKVTRTINAPAGARLAVSEMNLGPDGRIYMASMGDGHVYVLDGVAGTISDTGVGGGDTTQSIYGVAWSRDSKFAYLSNTKSSNDSPQIGDIVKVEWPGGKLAGKIENATKWLPAGSTSPMAHQTAVTPDGKFMYVTDGVAGAVVKIDLNTDMIVKTTPAGKEPHSMVISADGRTAYITVRHEPVENESSIFLYDMVQDQVTGRIPGIQTPLASGLIYAP